MELLIVDESKCKRDGICAEVCPSRIILFKKNNGFPKIPGKLEKGCIQCGHCVSVCPHDALSHRIVPAESCPPIDPALTVNQAQAEQFLRSRRSIRVFKDEPVPKEKISRLIHIARYAPTAGNSQQVAWRVVTDRDIISRAADLTAAYLKHVIDTHPKGSYPAYYPPMVAGYRAGLDPITRRAPVLLVASNPSVQVSGMVDLSLALSYLELMAPAMGLGTCWAGLVGSALKNDSQLKDLLGLPGAHAHFYSMLLGYPRYEYRRMPVRRPPA
ncbi:MAG: 4Fe-4S binding protein, partial [Desulfatitalea sp.]|nr:4Fe-4S binding protein [Desulfatitalea sp.]